MEKKLELTTIQPHLEHLRQLCAKTNNGCGVSCVEGVITTIEQGDLVGAMVWYRLDSDKLRQYPELQSYMKQLFGDPYSDEFDQELDELQLAQKKNK